MSRTETIETFQLLNDALWTARQEDMSPITEFRGRPIMRVYSLEPWRIMRYGRIANRAPRMEGEYPLLAFAPAFKSHGNLVVRPVIEAAGDEMYVLPGIRPHHLLQAANLVGIDLELTKKA